ncbi:MAG: ParB/RepB/Spo0J family partition protein [Parvibaculales bacterium]
MNDKKRGLGRGLSALIGDTVEQAPAGNDAAAPASTAAPMAATETASGQPQRLGVDQLQAGKFQPRQNFADEDLQALAASIAKSGILQPLLVRPLSAGAAGNGTDGAAQYEIIAGERRWRAAQLAKLHDVPVIVQNINDVTALEIGIIENVQRADLNPIEEAEGYQRLISEFAYTQAELADTIGKSRSHIANLLRLTEAPQAVRQALIDGKISMGHARALLGVEEPAALVKQIIAEGLSVRAVEKLAAAAKPNDASDGKADGRPASGKAEKDADTRALEKTISDALGLAVSIDDKGADCGGAVTLEYKTLEQLDDVVAKLIGN